MHQGDTQTSEHQQTRTTPPGQPRITRTRPLHSQYHPQEYWQLVPFSLNLAYPRGVPLSVSLTVSLPSCLLLSSLITGTYTSRYIIPRIPPSAYPLFFCGFCQVTNHIGFPLKNLDFPEISLKNCGWLDLSNSGTFHVSLWEEAGCISSTAWLHSLKELLG